MYPQLKVIGVLVADCLGQAQLKVLLFWAGFSYSCWPGRTAVVSWLVQVSLSHDDLTWNPHLPTSWEQASDQACWKVVDRGKRQACKWKLAKPSGALDSVTLVLLCHTGDTRPAQIDRLEKPATSGYGAAKNCDLLASVCHSH